LAEIDPNISARQPEDVIAESTAYCRQSGRLTWVVLDWLINNIAEIDERELLEKTEEFGDFSVLGVICGGANQQQPDMKFTWLMRACQPHEELEPFFLRVAGSPLASQLARENNLELFKRWNYYSNELRYLTT